MTSAKAGSVGSFHAYLGVLRKTLEASDAEYEPPTFPVEMPTFDECVSSPPEFGRDIRRKHFLLTEEFTFLNHGAFGTAVKESLDVCQKLMYYTDTQPLRQIDRNLIPLLCYVTREMAGFVGCDATDLVLITNATTAASTILRSLAFQKGDVIYSLDVIYGAVNKAVDHVCALTGAVSQQEHLPVPLESEEAVLELISSTLKEGTKLAVFDHIPTTTAVILPIKKIVELCHSRNVPVMVDGAHALGSLDLNLKDIGADFYFANCHKWFCAPKSSAIMYVDKKYQHVVRPLVVSWGFGRGFGAEFIWQGTGYYSFNLALHTTLRFWKTIGPERIRTYCHDLAVKAAHRLADLWGTSLMAPDHLLASMASVELPKAFNDWQEDLPTKMVRVQDALFFEYKIEVPIRVQDDKLALRISAHVYNEYEEYERLGTAILELATKTGELRDYSMLPAASCSRSSGAAAAARGPKHVADTAAAPTDESHS